MEMLGLMRGLKIFYLYCRAFNKYLLIFTANGRLCLHHRLGNICTSIWCPRHHYCSFCSVLPLLLVPPPYVPSIVIIVALIAVFDRSLSLVSLFHHHQSPYSIRFRPCPATFSHQSLYCIRPSSWASVHAFILWPPHLHGLCSSAGLR